MTSVTEQKTEILEHIRRGSIGNEVLDCLKTGDGLFVERESELWDYKQQLGSAKLDETELVRDVLAFHNSFGGYLLFGVSDDGKACGCGSVNEQTIRQLLRAYAGIDLPVIVADHAVFEKKLVLIYIPKRLQAEVPVAISKIGPEIKSGRPIFKPGDIFFRSNDASQLLRGSDDLRFLMGERRHSADRAVRASGVRVISNNLPERSIVFNRFFGRDEVKEELWNWLADPMSRYRVLAGPGGFGKTSAAYSFCEEVCSESPLGIEQVAWLSAKRNQFSAARNEASALPYNQESRLSGEGYSSYESLLDAISYHLPISDEEWEGYDNSFKIRKLAEGLEVIPTLLVIDDLDSLTPDDQRMAVELAMSLGRSSSRFLFTTRKNYLAPSSSTTEIRGLEGKEYDDFVEYLQDSYGRKLNSSELKGIAQDTEGSPLFTESIFRLLKLGARFGDAITRWKGTDGEAVRAAAFRRELEQLAWGSKRALFSIAMFETVSIAEIRQMAELELVEVESAIGELDRLFLVQSKQIGDQARFGVAPNLRRLLQDLKNELIPNHIEITRRASNLRSETKQGLSRGKNKQIAAVIQQAMAQLTQSDFVGSLSTIESTLKLTDDSADLWMVYARCLTNLQPIDVAKVRKAFQKSFDLGKREPQLFLKWIDFELEFGDSNAAIDVGDKGSAVLPAKNWEWLTKLAAAYFERGRAREARREFTDSISDLRLSSSYLAKALKNSPGSARPSVVSAGQEVHDALWKICKESGQYSVPEQYQIAKSAVDLGDRRAVCLARMIDVIEAGVLDAAYRSKNNSRLQSWAHEVETVLESRSLDRLGDRLVLLKKKLQS